MCLLGDIDGDKVAIKLITPSAKRKNRRIIEEAEKEIQFLEMLENSPNVVKLIRSEIKDSSAAIVLEYCISSLQGWMNKEKVLGGDIPSEKVIDDFVPFFSGAIRQMRVKNIVHIDLKPGNILRCDGVWKVADFGLAVEINDGQQIRVSPKGTPNYTDPELLETGIANSRTDLYSVGSILYELVTGETYDEQLDLNLDKDEPVYLDEDVDDGLAFFIDTLLKRKFKSFEDFYNKISVYTF